MLPADIQLRAEQIVSFSFFLYNGGHRGGMGAKEMDR
jgi:hypothetical protein